MKKLIAPMLIGLILISIIMSCDSKKSTEPDSEPTFNNFQEEEQYIIDSNFPVDGIAVGVIKRDEELQFFHGMKSNNNNEPSDENTVCYGSEQCGQIWCWN